MSEHECGAIPPNVGGPIPCHLEPGHDEHLSTSGCAGSEIRWTTAPDSTPTEREAGDAGEVAAMLAAAPDHGGWRAGMDADDYLALAAALTPLIAARERAAGARALREAADDWRGEGRDVMFNRARSDLTPQGRVEKWLRDRAEAR